MGTNWGLLGAFCGVCLAPFTGGTSLVLTCATCAAAGYVGGTVIGAIADNNNSTLSQASPEAYNLLGKSIEELAKLREKVETERNEELAKKQDLEKELQQIRDKIQNPNLREPHETKQSLQEHEMLLVTELRKINQRLDEKNKQLNTITQQQANVTTTGANTASDSISNANLGNLANNFKPSFTTKLIIAGAVIFLVYLLVVKK